jgi:hypothetical protein
MPKPKFPRLAIFRLIKERDPDVGRFIQNEGRVYQRATKRGDYVGRKPGQFYPIGWRVSYRRGLHISWKDRSRDIVVFDSELPP